MKIALLGSSEFSKIVLEKLYSSRHEVVCVVCNQDKQTGRGQKIVFSPAKVFALQNNIPVLQYKSISKQGYDEVKSYNPDVLITAAFGQILRQNIIDLAKFGVINVHASILPKYRGSCPINWVLINGEKSTGVTIMKTDIGLDTGDIILKQKTDILPEETAGELTLRLAEIGAEALLTALDKIEYGTAKYTKQDEAKSSYYPMLNKEMGKIDFNKTATQISNLCRGLNPWPVCYVDYNGDKLKVFSAKPYLVSLQEKQSFKEYKNGQVVLSSSKTGLVVKCENGFVLLEKIQAPNSKPMFSKDFLNGKKIEVGTWL